MPTRRSRYRHSHRNASPHRAQRRGLRPVPDSKRVRPEARGGLLAHRPRRELTVEGACHPSHREHILFVRLVHQATPPPTRPKCPVLSERRLRRTQFDSARSRTSVAVFAKRFQLLTRKDETSELHLVGPETDLPGLQTSATAFLRSNDWHLSRTSDPPRPKAGGYSTTAALEACRSRVSGGGSILPMAGSSRQTWACQAPNLLKTAGMLSAQRQA